MLYQDKTDDSIISEVGLSAFLAESKNRETTIINNNNIMLNKILTFLSGKKSIIAGLITTTSAYLVSIGYINADTGAFIAAISLIIFGTASVATTRMYNSQFQPES